MIKKEEEEEGEKQLKDYLIIETFHHCFLLANQFNC